MLSSLPGSAVSQVKMDGVVHEFSTIPGVKEDIAEIILNIKSLAIKNTSDSSEVKTAYIEAEGEQIVTAGDIQTDSDIEILNPDLVIATLNGGHDSKLNIELTITQGRGYACGTFCVWRIIRCMPIKQKSSSSGHFCSMMRKISILPD